MVLLVLRHTLPVIVNRAGHYSFPLIMVSYTGFTRLERCGHTHSEFLICHFWSQLLLLRITGIILPIYIIMKAVISVLRRRHNRVRAVSSLTIFFQHLVVVTWYMKTLNHVFLYNDLDKSLTGKFIPLFTWWRSCHSNNAASRWCPSALRE